MANPGHLAFSFQHLDTTRAKFSLSDCDNQFFCGLLDRMKALSQLTPREFVNLRATGGAWRVHRIDWQGLPRVSERSFGLPIQLTADENAWQFTISKRNGRVHGFVIDGTFFVRWMDPKHNLYNGGPD
jgi:hypothetical protein